MPTCTDCRGTGTVQLLTSEGPCAKCGGTGEASAPFRIGDRVTCHMPGSWVDGRVGTVLKLDAHNEAGEPGHFLQMEGGTTVVSPDALTKADGAAEAWEKGVVAVEGADFKALDPSAFAGTANADGWPAAKGPVTLCGTARGVLTKGVWTGSKVTLTFPPDDAAIQKIRERIDQQRDAYLAECERLGFAPTSAEGRELQRTMLDRWNRDVTAAARAAGMEVPDLGPTVLMTEPVRHFIPANPEQRTRDLARSTELTVFMRSGEPVNSPAWLRATDELVGLLDRIGREDRAQGAKESAANTPESFKVAAAAAARLVRLDSLGVSFNVTGHAPLRLGGNKATAEQLRRMVAESLCNFTDPTSLMWRAAYEAAASDLEDGTRKAADRPTFVVAGDYRQFVDWCFRNQEAVAGPGAPQFVSGLERIQGVTGARIVFCGSWYDRPDAREIRDYAETRQPGCGLQVDSWVRADRPLSLAAELTPTE